MDATAKMLTATGSTGEASRRGIGPFKYDLFIDLSESSVSSEELQAYIDRLLRDGAIAGVAGVIKILFSGDSAPQMPDAGLHVRSCDARQPSRAAYRAVRGAADASRHLVILFDMVEPSNELLARLIDEFDRDPMFGTVQPRFSTLETDEIWPLGGINAEDCLHLLPRNALPLLPEYTITPELLGVCMVIRREVLQEVDQCPDGFGTVRGFLKRHLSQARRRGYRNLVSNRTVMGIQLPGQRAYPLLSVEEQNLLYTAYPEVGRADSWSQNHWQSTFETLLSCARSNYTNRRLRLLLDCRGLPELHNGTSQHIIGMLVGFHSLETEWTIDILVNSAAADFHQIAYRFDHFGILEKASDAYSVGILLNQPWAISTVAELHQHAFFVGFNILDTIAWDIMYAFDDTYLDALWRFIGKYSDALFFISHFSLDRFMTRFPVDKGVSKCVTYLSFARDEQINKVDLRQATDEYLLVVGNAYEHKDVDRTVALLTDAFPFCKVAAIGGSTRSRTVTTYQSGQIPADEFHRLIAGARLVIFPSFYEGFGIPVVQALAYSRPVIVRQSPLWYEIASRLRSSGQLLTFDSPQSFVERVGAVLARQPTTPVVQGGSVLPGEAPLTWKDCARRMLETADALLHDFDGGRWQERNEALRACNVLRN